MNTLSAESVRLRKMGCSDIIGAETGENTERETGTEKRKQRKILWT